jgi:demethylmenaquinone methyltransferase / 2-methoxy-6-polyprenyl-1,4-benzoquinol methylase
MDAPSYRDEYVQSLFDRMGPTYDIVNVLSSFGFSSLWRRECVRNAGVHEGDRVCDMMAGSGECWSYVPERCTSLASVDFSREMVARQQRRKKRSVRPIEILAENALQTSISGSSIDCVISAFGLKTLSAEALRQFASEIHRILKPGGRFSLLEISRADGWILAPAFRWYVNSVIPWVGRLCLGDIECYRMLGAYTNAFGSCRHAALVFADVGFDVSLRSHFYGCATSLVGSKPA